MIHIRIVPNPLSNLLCRSPVFCWHPGLAGDMVVLRAGLCPGLTEDMIQLLRANGIRTGNGAAVASWVGEHHSLHV